MFDGGFRAMRGIVLQHESPHDVAARINRVRDRMTVLCVASPVHAALDDLRRSIRRLHPPPGPKRQAEQNTKVAAVAQVVSPKYQKD